MEPLCSETGCGRPASGPASGRGLCSRHYQYYRYHGSLDEVAPRPESQTCEHCGQTFDPKRRRYGAMYCSKRCNDNARTARKRATRGMRAEVCAQCGIALPVDRRSDTRFCSTRCGQNWRNAQTGARTLAEKAASGRICRGCGDPIAPERPASALYCSEACKIASRRHETYGLTKHELDVLLDQHEVCAICLSSDWGQKGPQVDHDHATGRVRGVLCNNCNNGLGRFRDDPALLLEAVAYLT